MSEADVFGNLGSDWGRVKDLLRETLSSDVQLLQDVNTGILQHSGKMLRPAVTLLLAKACNGGRLNDVAVKYAAAVEILHNATLLHDDVADEAATRRGVPTLMARMGATPAVLVGDFWLAKSISLLSEIEDMKGTIGIFAGTLINLAEGEMLQQEKAIKGDTTLKDYLQIIFCKTASLFRAAGMCGARSVAAPERYCKAAADYGEALGMAFQIQDDILDYDGGDTGKPSGIDLQEQKITLPLLGALSSSGKEAQIRQMVKEIPVHPEYCGTIRSFVADNGGVAYAQGILEDYVNSAISSLSPLPDSEEKEILMSLARHSADRKK